MKRFIFSSIFVLLTTALFAQPIFDLGVKLGINNSKVTANPNEFTTESIVKAHIGAFARVGVGRVYVQPEAYFSTKGGNLKSGLYQTVTSIDFNSVDVPVLLGVKVIKGAAANVRVMAGPVFSFLTNNDISGDIRFTPQYFKDNYFGYQYGVGVDFWSFTLDARMDHGTNSLYAHPSLDSKNRTFLVTLGIKLL